MKYSYITTTVVGQKLVLLLGLNGISAELLVGDNPIAFDEFKATQTNHISKIWLFLGTHQNI